MEKKQWKISRYLLKNILLYAIGVGIMPLGVVLTINSHSGAGGYDALNFAIADALHIQTSLAIYGTAFIAILLAAIIRGSFPRITTFVSSFFLGVFTEVWKFLLQDIEGTTLLSKVILLLIGIIIIAFAVACYIICIFPTNPTDDLVLAMKERGLKLGLAKILFDGICVVLALLLQGEIGFGTLVCTFGLGPIIDIFHQLISKKLEGAQS